MQSVCNECYWSSKTWIIPNKCSVSRISQELVILRERQQCLKNRTTSWKEGKVGHYTDPMDSKLGSTLTPPAAVHPIIWVTRWQSSASQNVTSHKKKNNSDKVMFQLFECWGWSNDGRHRWLIRIDWACNQAVPGSNPGWVGYLSSWLCIYCAPNCSRAWSVQCCFWYFALCTLQNPWCHTK